MLWKIRHICKKNWQIRAFDKKCKKLRKLWKLGHLGGLYFIVNCDSNWKSVVRIIWRYYFIYSFTHISQVFNILFKKFGKIKLFTFLK